MNAGPSGSLPILGSEREQAELTTENRNGPLRYCRNIFFAMNSTFAGRSARRRM